MSHETSHPIPCNAASFWGGSAAARPVRRLATTGRIRSASRRTASESRWRRSSPSSPPGAMLTSSSRTSSAVPLQRPGYRPDEDFEIVSLYLDQSPRRDMGRAVAKEAADPDLPDDRRIARRSAATGWPPTPSWLSASTAIIRSTRKASASTRGSGSSTRSSRSSGRAARRCRCSTTSTCPTAGTGPRRCTTRPSRWASA